MRYISVTEEEKRQMLDLIGADRVEDLFGCIPEHLKIKRELNIPEEASEPVVLRYFSSQASRNAAADRFPIFLGAGAYHHFIPSVIDAVISRSEFYTAYTPYQPEISQGTLQAIFEYQTLICQLTGMEVANASLYDGSSALAEAVLMAHRMNKRGRVILPAGLHPHYRHVLQTYTSNLGIQVDEVPLTAEGGLDAGRLHSLLSDEHTAVVVQTPNFFGIIEDLESLLPEAQSRGLLTIVVVAEALSLGLLKPPGELGADIVVGEGQSFGIPLGFGGPYLGFFATQDRHKRQMPGRVAGLTTDSEGRPGFVLTLSTREQHIRREKATSNICTNQGLCALMASVFLSTLGRQGLRQMAEQNMKKTHFLRGLVKEQLVFSGPVFNEVTLRCSSSPEKLNQKLMEAGIIGGLPLGRYFPGRADQMLVCVTEQSSRQDIERFVDILTRL
jgi:glycine dehydrogenase subunit 1